VLFAITLYSWFTTAVPNRATSDDAISNQAATPTPCLAISPQSASECGTSTVYEPTLASRSFCILFTAMSVKI
jgi:hypothetical protein